MRKIFYNPKTLKIMGMSEGENSIEYPYIETEKDYHSTVNLKITNPNKPKLEVENGYWDKNRKANNEKNIIKQRLQKKLMAEQIKQLTNK